MKKVKFLFIFVICCIVLTGCGENGNSLSCTAGGDTEINYEFEEEKVKIITLVEVEKYESLDEAKTSAAMYKSVGDVITTDGVKVDVSIKDKSVIIKTIYTIDKLTQSEKMNLSANGLSYDKSRNEIKEEMESHSGISCK